MATARNEARRDHTGRRADAERNTATILAAGMELFCRHADVSMTDVAKAAGLGRVTLYAHFPTRADLLYALARQAIAEAEQAIDATPVDPDAPADQVLTRLIDATWHVLDRYRKLRTDSLTELGPDQLAQRHDPIRHRLEKIVARGQEQGRFRTDLPLDWLTTVIFGLIHAAADEIEAGRLDPDTAPGLLTATLLGALQVPGGA